MMLWHTGPANIRSDIDIKHINRAKTITRDRLDQFYKLDHASMPVGERPKPVSNLPPDLEIEKWFNESNNHVESKMKNMAWIIARMCQTSQHMVPAWAAFNEKISLVNSPITTPGMLPILQAPADDNNTMTTILNRFTSIAKHLGQPNTLNSTTKSDLVNILMDGETIPHTIPAPTMHQNTCVLIDGHALVQALGKPQTCRTFDDYARVFFRAVTAHVDEHVRRVDVVFDTYVKQSIKSATRAKRGIKETSS